MDTCPDFIEGMSASKRQRMKFRPTLKLESVILVGAIAKKSGTATSDLRILLLFPFPAVCLKPRVALAPDHQGRRRWGGGDGSKITCPEGMFVNKSHFFSGCLALVAIVSSMSRVHAGVIAIDLTGKTGDNAGLSRISNRPVSSVGGGDCGHGIR